MIVRTCFRRSSRLEAYLEHTVTVRTDLMRGTAGRASEIQQALAAMRDDIQRFSDLVLDRIGVERASS